MRGKDRLNVIRQKYLILNIKHKLKALDVADVNKSCFQNNLQNINIDSDTTEEQY